MGGGTQPGGGGTQWAGAVGEVVPSYITHQVPAGGVLYCVTMASCFTYTFLLLRVFPKKETKIKMLIP